MAVIKDFKNHSTIQIRKDIYFVFGSLEGNDEPIERIKSSISEFKKYHELLGLKAPDVVMAWKTAEEGDWVLSDDYRVVQILKKTPNDNPKGYNSAIIRTCVGTFAVNPKSFLDTDFKLHPDRYRVSNSGKEQPERIIEREKITTNERVFAKRVAQGDDAQTAYMKTFPTKNKSYAKEMSRMLVRQERIQKNISSEIEQLLREEGVSKRYIIQEYKRLVDNGMLDLKNCSGSVRAALSDLVDIAGMKPDKTKSSQSMGVLQEVEDDLLGEVEEAEYNIVSNSNGNDEFEQEFLEENNKHELALQEHKKQLEKVGDNLLTKAGLDLLS